VHGVGKIGGMLLDDHGTDADRVLGRQRGAQALGEVFHVDAGSQEFGTIREGGMGIMGHVNLLATFSDWSG
jgi:hypothetical protein